MQVAAKRTERDTMEAVATAKPSQRVEEAKAERDKADEFLDEIDALLEDEVQQGLDEERRRVEFLDKLRSINFAGRRQCCGACDPCPYGR